MNRNLFWGVLVIGLALVIAPLAMSLPAKAGAGERMLNGFQPIMQPAQVAKTAYYYNDVFVPLGTMTTAMSSPRAQHALAGLFGPTAQKSAGIMSQVPAGLRHYKPLVTTMQANVDNFRQVNSLPSFRLFAWFFIVPGALLILLGAVGLFGGATRTWIAVHHHPRPTTA